MDELVVLGAHPDFAGGTRMFHSLACIATFSGSAGVHIVDAHTQVSGKALAHVGESTAESVDVGDPNGLRRGGANQTAAVRNNPVTRKR